MSSLAQLTPESRRRALLSVIILLGLLRTFGVQTMSSAANAEGFDNVMEVV